MKKLAAISLVLLVLGLGLSLVPGPQSPVPAAIAATADPRPTQPGYTPMVIPLMGNYTASRTAIIKFTAPAGYRVVNATVTARAKGGTSPTLKVRAKSGSFLLYSTSVTAGSIAEAKLVAAPNIADEADVSYDLVIGGTSPTWADITIFQLLKRR